MGQDVLLKMVDITKTFPGVKALDKVGLEVQAGTVHALMGENGAGKSTLMKCLFGIYSKDGGHIYLEGREVNFKSSKEALENGVAMVHQELNQALKRSVMDNIWLGRYPTVAGIAVNERKMYKDTMAVFQELGIDVESYDFNVYTDLIPLFYEAKEKRDALHPEYADYPISGPRWGIFPYDFAIECFLDELLCCNITGLVEQGADGIDPSQVYCLFETDDFRAYALQMQQLVEDGIYPYEAPADIWNSEKVFCWPGWGYVTIDEHMVSPDFVSTLYVPNIWWTDTGNLQTAGYAISSMCAHPDRAMEVLELLNTDTYVATTMRFGIEGTHWVRDEEGKITFEGTINERRDVYYRWYGNEIGGMSAVEVPEINGGQAFIDLLHQYNDSATLTDHLGFVFDTTNVSNEVAACNNVYSEYKNNLQNGLYESQEETEAMLDEFLAKLQANGLDTLKTECQAQIDAWTAAQAN